MKLNLQDLPRQFQQLPRQLKRRFQNHSTLAIQLNSDSINVSLIRSENEVIRVVQSFVLPVGCGCLCRQSGKERRRPRGSSSHRRHSRTPLCRLCPSRLGAERLDRFAGHRKQRFARLPSNCARSANSQLTFRNFASPTAVTPSRRQSSRHDRRRAGKTSRGH